MKARLLSQSFLVLLFILVVATLAVYLPAAWTPDLKATSS